MAQTNYSHSSDNQEIRLHYDMLIADHYNINISFDYQANSDVAITRIITILSTSQNGTDVELKILKNNNDISFVRYNLPALKSDELKDIELEIYPKLNGPSGSDNSSQQWPKLKRKIEAHESELTTHTALMFMIDVEQEIFRGQRRKKQSVFYVYSHAPAKQHLDQELKETGLCKGDITPLSPSLSLAALTWMSSNDQQELFSDLRLPCYRGLSVESLGRAVNQVKLTHGLLLADHYQLDTSAEFMANSNEAVVRVLTQIETTTTGSEVDIQFQKKNSQISFVRFEIKDLKTNEFQDFEVDIKCEGHRRGCSRLYFPKTKVNPKLTIPRSHNTTQIKVAYIFNVTSAGCSEPKILYIYTKDDLVLPTFEEARIKSSSITEDQQPITVDEFSYDVTSNLIEGSAVTINEVNAVLNKPDTVKSVPNDSDKKIKIHVKGLTEELLQTIKKCISDSVREDETTCIFDIFSEEISSTMEQVMEKIELGKRVIVNHFNITNNFNFGPVENAHVGQGDLNIHY